MKDRMFGVEIECGITPIENGEAYCNEWDEPDIFEFLADSVKKAKVSDEWGWDNDGTYVEFQSPRLSGRTGFTELHRMMKFILDNGGYVTGRDGLHVHHDAPEFIKNKELVMVLVRSWTSNRSSIGKLVDPRRERESSRREGPCPTWIPAEIVQFEKYVQDPDAREGYFGRRDLNVSSLHEHGTIELRLHEGTLDFPQAEAWIRFGQAFLNKVSNTKVELPAYETPAELLQRLVTSQVARARLLARAEANRRVVA